MCFKLDVIRLFGRITGNSPFGLILIQKTWITD